jgi:DNA (cytosine-5)-methyltransferase 1
MRAIDLFSGWGGFTLAAEQAGVEVAWAANHWQLAVEAHATNHPGTVHACQDLRQADWSKLPAFDLLLASPACQGHSRASQPKRSLFHNALRSTAWAVIDCADMTEPKAILVENVPSFQEWRLYPAWRRALEALGYHVAETTVTASRHGAPQRRTRLFVSATRYNPRKAFSELDDAATRFAPEMPFGPCIDWNDGDWRPISEAAPGARPRIEAAIANHGPRCLTQHVTGHSGVPLDEPIRTVTTQDHWAVIDGDKYRPLTVRETARAMGFPDTYRWPEGSKRRDQIKGLGNAVCPPAARKMIERLAQVAA